MDIKYKLMWLFTALVILLQACAGGPIPVADGQVLALAEQSTVAGIYSVLNGAQPLGEVWTKGAQSVVAWPQSGGWAWACLRFNCEGWLGYFKFTAQGQGNVANWKTWSDLAGWMKANGWVKLPGATLPGALTAGETVAGFLSQMSGAITGFLVIPVMPEPEEVERPIT